MPALPHNTSCAIYPRSLSWWNAFEDCCILMDLTLPISGVVWILPGLGHITLGFCGTSRQFISVLWGIRSNCLSYPMLLFIFNECQMGLDQTMIDHWFLFPHRFEPFKRTLNRLNMAKTRHPVWVLSLIEYSCTSDVIEKRRVTWHFLS